jgi:hypothetical protein
MAIVLEPDNGKWMTLSREQKVAVTIQKLNDLNDPRDVPYFSNIAKHISKFDDMSKTTVHNALNHLVDLGMINAEWTQVDTRWVRKFIVIGESREWITKLTRELYG